MPLEIVVADDHTLFRKALVSVLENDRKYSVTGDVANGEDLMGIVNQKSPDIVLLDLAIPKINGYEVLKWLKKKNANTKTLVISAYNDDFSIGKAIEEGANGFLDKSAGGDEILSALNSIVENGFYLTERVNRAMAKRLVVRTRKNPNTDYLNIRLADREVSMIKMYSEGLTNSEISKFFFISPRTVETIRQQMIKKTGVKNIIGLILFAVKNGLINL